MLESTVASVNSALQRARGATERHLPDTIRPTADPVERELLDRYVAAFEQADMDGPVALLPRGRDASDAPQPTLVGGLEIAQFFHETAREAI